MDIIAQQHPHGLSMPKVVHLTMFFLYFDLAAFI